MASRIGRKYAQDTYPVSRGVSGQTFARSSGFGPNFNTTITSTASPPTQVFVWFIVENSLTENVPSITVTPRSSGILHITATVVLNNPTGAAIQFSGCFTVNTVPFDQVTEQSIAAGTSGSASLNITLIDQPVGTPVNIGLKVSGNGLVLLSAQTYASVEEVGPATN